MTIQMSRFALVCQAARLLGQALSQAYKESESDEDICVRLERTLQSMLAAALDNDPLDIDQISSIYRQDPLRWTHDLAKASAVAKI